MPIFYAELQLLGRQVPCTLVEFSFDQAIDENGRPSSTVRIRLLKVTLTGEPVGWGLWEELKFDEFRRVSGWVLYFNSEGHTAKTYKFYDAALVGLIFQYDGTGKPTQMELSFSPATVEVNGQHMEAYSVIPWKTDPKTSFRALTKPPDPLPSAHLAALLASKLPAALPVPPPVVPTPFLGAASLPAQPLPKMRTGAERGLPPTPDSIRTGEVAMEQHPDYPALVQHLAQRGYPLMVKGEGSPHVVFKRICDKQGNILREEKYVVVVAGMRFLDLEHEAGHVEQLEGNLGGNLPTEKLVQLRPDREVPAKNAPDVLAPWQDAVTEYHVRLLEYQRLADRRASSELLAKHLDGLRGSAVAYHNAVFGKFPKPALSAWVAQHFPDLYTLINQVPSHKRL